MLTRRRRSGWHVKLAPLVSTGALAWAIAIRLLLERRQELHLFGDLAESATTR